MLPKFIFSVLVILFLGNTSLVLAQKSTGKWYNYDFLENFMVFDTLGYFNVYADGYGFLFSDEGLPYLIETNKNDSLLIIQIGSLFKARVHYFGNYIVFINYKSGEIADHIDEVGLFLKNKMDKDALNFASNPKLEIIIPENFTGQAYVAFSQFVDDGLPNITPEKTTIRIKENGLLRTSILQDPLIYARKNEIFRYESSDKILPVFHLGFSRIKDTKYDLRPKDICILSLGFNQSARSLINKKFGQDIEGDVGQYIVDTFENLVKFDKIK